MTEQAAVKWLAMPAHHDYAAAEDYLRLVLSPKHVDLAVRQLREAKHTHPWKAKDILRAAGLDGLPAADLTVRGPSADLGRIRG